MIIYAESNFVLEMALRQEESTCCEKILNLCRAGQATLVIPAFSLAEPFETAVRRHTERRQLHERLARELRQLLRTQSFSSQKQASEDITALLLRSTKDEWLRLTAVIQDIVAVAQTIPLTGAIIEVALAHQSEGDFSAQDAIIYASIVSHLQETKPTQSCFLNKNRKDFSSPERVAELKALGCRLIYTFRDGLQFVESLRI